MQDRAEFLDRRVAFVALRGLQLCIGEHVLAAYEGDGLLPEDLPLAAEVRDSLEQEMLLVRARAAAWGMERHARDTLLFAVRGMASTSTSTSITANAQFLSDTRARLEELGHGQLADALQTLGLPRTGSAGDKRERLRACLEWLEERGEEELPLVLEEYRRTHEKKRGRPRKE
jgi:hypothetical protein